MNMQKLGLYQSLQNRLSPQQIQFIKLLQVPSAELDRRIQEEMQINPALEEREDEYGREDLSTQHDEKKIELHTTNNKLSGKETNSSEEPPVNEYYRDRTYYADRDQTMELPLSNPSSLQESLLTQLGYISLTEHEKIIGRQLIGSIDEDGYMRHKTEDIINDMAVILNVQATPNEVESMLQKIQSFDPPGIAARTLQECLLLQLERIEGSDKNREVAKDILRHHFTEFLNKQYAKIQKKKSLLTESELRNAIEIITQLTPKPGGGANIGMESNTYIIPDYVLRNVDGKLEVVLNSRNAPNLYLSRSYLNLMRSYEKNQDKDEKLKETVAFVKQKLESARWFIDAIKQRQITLLQTMNAILEMQYSFFMEGDETLLKPMILKDIATKIDMNISTVSRIVSSKTIQTDFGIYSLKYLFSEGITNESGEEISNREVKKRIEELINQEEKNDPLSDEKIEAHLHQQGYTIARRTVAKYREQMNIPVARLRKVI